MKWINKINLAIAPLTLGLAAFSASYAIKNSRNNNQSSDLMKNSYEKLSDALNELDSIYKDKHDNLSDQISINENNFSDANDSLSTEITEIKIDVEQTEDNLLQIFKDDIKTTIDYITGVIQRNQVLTDQAFNDIMTKIAELSSKIISIESWREIINSDISDVASKQVDMAKDFWAAIDSLKLEMTNINDKADVNTDNIKKLVITTGIIEDKMVEIETTVQEVEKIKFEVEKLETFLDKVSTALDQKIGNNGLEIDVLKKEVLDLKSILAGYDTSLANINRVIGTMTDEILDIRNKMNSLELSIKLNGDTNNAIANSVIDIKNQITNLENSKNATSAEITKINQKFVEIQGVFENLDSNAQIFDQRLSFIEENTNNLTDTLLNITNEIKNINSEINGIKKSNTINYNFDMLIVQGKLNNKKGEVIKTFDEIYVPDMKNVKRLNVDFEFIDDEAKTSFITNIIDTHPVEGFDIVGSAISTNSFQYIVNFNILDNYININSLSYRRNGDFIDISKYKKLYRIIVKNVTAFYDE